MQSRSKERSMGSRTPENLHEILAALLILLRPSVFIASSKSAVACDGSRRDIHGGPSPSVGSSDGAVAAPPAATASLDVLSTPRRLVNSTKSQRHCW
ncbi:hypothetical protein PC116_g18705 [Phytophthora cactorum]|uniref:Uncharacterized protein n=1 Tax=Phytophthora cactorum TaxID=29920 RepID=A0A8T1KBK3_9STRA|nr:hypothetical protein PC114_g16034 [Phytophthora cactorum]KAG2924131.1 hypothetical protein PC117_g15464 [Phytophthora cactorum]KAG2983371.1 hypothetical protein PC120_g24458 [Phytophthora cactorum]KAG3003613.1 hypothetical protein PC119_g15905 [Phytophthora cactorum]KAG4040028.1 hypothetical protein PC123_g24428 [Phytophthora cactorum]